VIVEALQRGTHLPAMLRLRRDHHLLEQRGELIRAHILSQHLRGRGGGRC